MDFSSMLKFYSWNEIPPEFLSSWLTMIIVIIIAVVIKIKLKKYDPLKKPKGFLHICEIVLEFAEKQTSQIMGDAFPNFGGYILGVGLYIIIGFIIGMIGIPNIFQPGSEEFLKPLPNPFTNLAMPLSLAIITFVLTHFTAIKYKKRFYFERYLEPFPFFLPINLVTMWSSVLSLTLRLFGNALAGYCIITLIYVGIGTIIPSTLGGFAIVPILAPVAHLYFDVFDGLIQLAVFTILTMINVSNEYVSIEAYQTMIEEKKEKKMKRHLKKNKKLS